MKHQCPIVLRTVLASAIMFAGLILSCNPSSSKNEITVSDFVITNQIPGWALTDSVRLFHDRNSLQAIMDGYADSYAQNLQAGMYENLNASQKSATVTIFVIDYGTPANARAQYDTMIVRNIVNLNRTEAAIPPFALTDAAAVTVRFGLTAYANFGKYYVEMDGLNSPAYDSTTKSLADASMFLTYFQSKAQ